MARSIAFDKEEMLEKIMVLFWDQGYHGTSIQDLVDISGLNRSSLYNTFGGKRKLYHAAISMYQSRQQKFINNLLINSSSSKEALVKLFSGIFDSILSDGSQKGCFLVNCTTELANSDKKARNFLMHNRRYISGIFKSLLKEGQAKGEIKPGLDASAYSLYLFTMLQGLKVTAMIPISISQLKHVVKQMLEEL